MKREIKFRVWHTDLKEMLYDFSFPSSQNINKQMDALQIMSPIMQFTGLKDKNGKEIYEGDIIRHKWSADWDSGGGQRIIEVKCDIDWGYYNYRCLSGLSGQIEVIGNIYENPELLKSE